MTTPVHADEDREIIRRTMPVNADGHATGPTTVTYADGRHEPWAYYATCCCCSLREPFYSPADRDVWSEAHRTEHPDHAMQLTSEPWDYRMPPWVAANGLPLHPVADPFAHMPPGFPRPDWDDATQLRVVQRQARLKRGCPRHDAQPQLTFYKELFVAGHMPVYAAYEDGCVVKWRLDVEEDPVYELVPPA
ncbi:hypothetical protein [Streptomyces longwoodensis]|uniref:hypothetical protein n=1 Tax=Streptomyces longwoodensis TaxID=68231 RepID=UPI0036F59286